MNETWSDELKRWGLENLGDNDDTSAHRYGPHRRLIAAIGQDQTGLVPLGGADLVVLTRAVLQAETAIRGSDQTLLVPRALANRVERSQWDAASITIIHDGSDGVRVMARPWHAVWLDDGYAGAMPDAALYERVRRRPEIPVAGDPMLQLLGWDAYHAEAQREAVRTVVSAPSGSTIIVNLPTGAGKSACAFLPALLATDAESIDVLGVTPIVVPTIALQQDLQTRVSTVVAHDTAYRPEHATADAILARTEEGLQGPVFLSPESLVGRFGKSLRKAARRGFIRCFVLDEAHIVTAWGDEFRPAFQQIAGFRRELLALCGECPFTTVLMSATLTPYSIETLCELFGSPGPLHHVHAVRLRPEPSYWIYKAPSEAKRQAAVLDALWHLPRPLILYTTKRLDAQRWWQRIRIAGMSRSAVIHGGSGDNERGAALAGWGRDEIDVMVATSAFGLGVDKQDVRAVLHAALPESVDRFYQDVGRGGRDGWASLSFLAWCTHDERPARKLAVPTFIGPDRGRERWAAMFFAPTREVLGNDVYVLPLDVAPSGRSRDIDMDGEENRRWNLRTILLLARSGLIEFTNRTPATSIRAPSTSWNSVTIRIRDHTVHNAAAWMTNVEPRRRAFLDASERAWDLMLEAVRGERCLSSIFADAYGDRRHSLLVTRACGGCPACRRDGVHFRPGPMVARHIPNVSWPPGRLGSSLTSFLADAPYALIFYDTRMPSEARTVELWEAVRWLCDQDVANLVLPRDLRAGWKYGFARHPSWRVYIHDALPTGILQRLPTAIVLDSSQSQLWRNLWASLHHLAASTIVLLPDDLTEPSRPDRLIRDILVGPPRLTLRQWQELYLE